MAKTVKHSGGSALRIGIDVGGTNTDAVLMRDRDVLASTKQPTTADVTTGSLEAFIAAGGLELVEDADIRGHLRDWRTRVEDLQDDEENSEKPFNGQKIQENTQKLNLKVVLM